MGDDALTALVAARAAGLEIRTETGRLIVRGPRSHADLAQRLLEHKSEIVVLLANEDVEVAWRVAAMRPQVPERGPIPVLMARDTTPSPGHCLSCGALLSAGQRYRCAPCVQATWSVLNQVREGVEPQSGQVE